MERRVALIVDDHADTAEMLRIFLQSEQLDSLAYHDFDDAYFALASLRPCIALIDLQVPGKMKAPEFIQKVRREHPTLPIVIVSADARAREFRTVAAGRSSDFQTTPADLFFSRQSANVIAAA
jgi:DNA-binding response OmpR family regulator